MDQHPEIEAAFLKLYDELGDAIFRHCYFRVSSREVAEDITQESFMKTWDYMAKGGVLDNPKAFIYRIAGNLIIDFYRKKKTTSLDALAEVGYDPMGDDAASIVSHAAGQQALGVMQKMEPLYRDVLVMRYVDDFSIGEIAATVGETENVVSVRLHRGIEKLKKLLSI